MKYIKLTVIFALFCQALSSAIPIWELLSYHEKVGNLTFIFMRLVNTYCKKSTVPDCERVLTLFGVSNLLKADESTLDLLDPHHWNSRSDLWRVAMNGAFEYPYEKSLQFTHRNSPTEVENDLNKITNSADMDYNFPNYYDYDAADISEPHPYAVKVPPPPEFHHTTPKSTRTAPTSTPSNKESSVITQRQLAVTDDPNYIVLLPHGSHFDDGSSGRFQNSRFQDFRTRSQLKEPRNIKKYNENSAKQSKNPLIFTVLKK